MKSKNWVLGAATGLVLVGSLLGVGCKSSTKKAAPTSTSQSKVTTPAKSPTTKAATAAKTPAATGTKAAATGTPPKTP